VFLLEPIAASVGALAFLLQKWDRSTSACQQLLRHTGSVFKNLFESSADAIWLYDPQSGLLTDCNQAAVELMGAENKQQLVPK
jgi:PAS domain-containing protein